MVARPFRCDPARLRLLLEDRLPEEDQAALAGHLEGCDSCRRDLERLAAESRWWGDARLLRGEEPGAAAAAEPPALDFLAPPEEPDALGRLGPYEVTGVIGKGGMGLVLKAVDPSLGRTVAIKVLAPELATSATARRRFAREARAAAAVAHEHIVAIYAVDATPTGLPYLVMPHVAGKSLQERLDRAGPLEVREVLRIGVQAASGLAAAHAQGLVHRDVKPANILLENCVERVKLTDFGLARAADDASLTQSGVVAGTPQYMAPEQARGEPVDARADLFSLGSVLYALCTGRPPFRAETTMGVLRRVCDDTPRPIRELNPDVPAWLAAIIAKLHAKDPAGRYQSAAEVADLLGRCLAHLEQPDRCPLPFEPERSAPRRVGGWVVAAVALLVTVAGLGAAEAAGVTKLADFVATVLRIRTPQGTLVVDVQDPEVKVRVDGEELVLTGAGPQEVRLKLGEHKVEATRGGKPVLEKLVAITRGDREVVTVSREPEPTATASLRGAGSQRPDDLKARLDAAIEQYTRANRSAQAPDPEIAKLRARVKELEAELAKRHPMVGTQWDRLKLENQCATCHKGIEPSLPGTGGISLDFDLGAGVPSRGWPSDQAVSRGADPASRATHPATIAVPTPVYRVAVAPDGKALAVAGKDGAIRLYALPGGDRLATIEAHGVPIRALAYAPDGRLLASAGAPVRQGSGEVRLWDVASGRVVRSLHGHVAPVWSVAFSPDGRALATGARDGTAKLWDVSSGKVRAALTGHTDAVTSVAFTPDRVTVATGSFDGTVKFWHATPEVGGALWATLRATEDGVGCLALAPDGKTMATSSRARHGAGRADDVVLWDLASHRARARLEGPGHAIVTLSFSPDGQTLVAGGLSPDPQGSGDVIAWEVATGREAFRAAGLDFQVASVAFSPDGRALIAGGFRGAEGKVRLWMMGPAPSPRDDNARDPLAPPREVR